MKRVLILAIGCSLPPWNKMFETSFDTWDSVEVDGVETIFYFGNPVRENNNKTIYFSVEESYFTMGEKMLQAFQWALDNKEFDYIARVNSSCYVDKKQLIKHIQTLPKENLFSGLIVQGENPWLWGGGQFILSKDVVEKLVENKSLYNHTVMEDVGISELATKIGIPFTQGKAASIDKTDSGWRLMGYEGPSFEFTNFADCNKSEQFFYRCKHDPDRTVDKYIMQELFKTLNS